MKSNYFSILGSDPDPFFHDIDQRIRINIKIIPETLFLMRSVEWTLTIWIISVKGRI